MGAIPIVGSCFSDVHEFMRYLDGVTFNLWRPRFVTVHHTGSPDLALWHRWQKRAPPIEDADWMHNLARYYGSEMGWSSGPHFFVTPAHICVLSPPNKRGVHAVSFNATSWGVETVGNFDSEAFEGPIRRRLVEALAVMHVTAGLSPEPYAFKQRGLHFHRDDPKTKKTCPGRRVLKKELVAEVVAAMETFNAGEHPSDVAGPVAAGKSWAGFVRAPDGLNVRASASGKAPVLRKLPDNSTVLVTGEAMNGETRWLQISEPVVGGWVAARFVDKR